MLKYFIFTAFELSQYSNKMIYDFEHVKHLVSVAGIW